MSPASPLLIRYIVVVLMFYSIFFLNCTQLEHLIVLLVFSFLLVNTRFIAIVLIRPARR